MTKRKRSKYEHTGRKKHKKRTFREVGTSSTLRRSSTSSNASSNISALARYSSQAAGAQLGFIAGNVPGAIQGAVYAGQAYDWANPRRQLFPKNSMNYGSGYAGRFNNRKYARDSMQKSLQIGSVCQIEQFGNIKDPHCVYIGHSTYQLNLISEAVRFALIRKVFQKAGVRVINRFEELPLFAPGNSDGFKLEYVWANPLTGSYGNAGYTTVDNDTLTTVTAGFANFKTNLELYLDSDDSRQPSQLNLYSSDRNGVDTNWRLAASLQLSDEEMHLQIKSNIKVQNRTAGDLAGAGDFNTERTDTQPLIVKGYHFMNGDPRTRAIQVGFSGDGNYSVLNGTHKTNIRLLRAGSEFGSTIAMQNSPPKSIFNNCDKVSSSILQPGAMKESTIYYNAKGRGMNFFKKLQHNLITSDIIAQTYGRFEFLVFEEKMRTVGTNPVSVHYERKYSIGFYSLTKKGGSIVPTLTTQELNLG